MADALFKHNVGMKT